MPGWDRRSMPDSPAPSVERVLLLLPTTSYRTQAFLDAAGRLGVEVLCASEQPSTLEALVPGGLLTLDFHDPDAAADRVRCVAARQPIHAVVGVDDLTAVAAAAIAERLGLRANPVAAVAATRNKRTMREQLAKAGVPVPRFRPVHLADDLDAAARQAEYPCVLKPLALSASRGVIRADSPGEFVAAARRIGRILNQAGDPSQELLAEEFLPGFEVALEGLLVDGSLEVLALFDKPDPLDGPFFEETIYVTPSRLPPEVQARIVQVTTRATAALGLRDGPIHAELRVNAGGPWILEVAARSIGGLCSRVLRFGTGMTLEELVLLHALGRPLGAPEREQRPAGVMMIPIPRAGRLLRVEGQAAARSVPFVEDVVVSAHPGQTLVPLPEGWRYLGFIFARGDTPEGVERALRAAHRQLHFEIG
jgi:biotin carboxylase